MPAHVPQHHTTRRAFVCNMSTATTVVADENSSALPTGMPWLVACPTNYVIKSSTPIVNKSSTPITIKNASLGALPGHMTRYIAQITNWVVGAVTSKMASLATVVACLLIRTLGSYMSLFVTIVAKPNVSRGKLWSRTIPGEVTRFAACVTNGIIRTLTRNMTRLPAIPTQ